MSEVTRVEPDLNFIKYLKSAGGDSVKKCFQCATCSVVCPLSTDGNPFPRKEMIWAQWGLKDRLAADPDTLLCHQCGDCTAYCPRGAKPGDVLGAIRAYTYTHFGFPKGLANFCSNGKNLPLMIIIPMFLIGVLFAVANGGFHIPDVETFKEVGFGQFFGHWDFHWLSKNVFFIDMIFVPAFLFAAFASLKGAKDLWCKMDESIESNKDFRPSAKQFVMDFLVPTVVETIQHKRFNECGENKNRVNGHLPLILSFIALFIVTNYGLLRKDIVSLFVSEEMRAILHGPIPLSDPFKILANVGAIALIIGIGILWANRSSSEEKQGTTPTFYDWFLIGEIMVVGITGLGAELIRLLGIPSFAYFLYFLHLVAVFMLFLYMPYTKFAHMIYRTVAMTFEKYRQSGFVKAVAGE
ncbi:MAG: quinone-interacting membrane-bound oxidoreductase complex subunit QmoC [Proteobacteria bacterium]|nr:quinone-interacting membrane-bound oxidoreductase complex subunit QmoC [Pseudomonadota bacterium]MBU1738960.1 quinone-interacting membrane-bound oxidoreductase complex subunit QmoC [Pseudomonadota bacterium]